MQYSWNDLVCGPSGARNFCTLSQPAIDTDKKIIDLPSIIFKKTHSLKGIMQPPQMKFENGML